MSLIALTSFSQAWALSIGDLKVTSYLGQPLRASAAIEVAEGESLDPRCLRLSAPSDVGMPNVSGVTLTLEKTAGGANLRFTGQAPMREPMSEMVLSVECPRAPVLTRSFLVFLDPPATAAAPGPAATSPIAANEARADSAPVTRPGRAARSRRDTLIEPGSVYTVQPGDILSVIASRVAGRPEYSVWPIAQRIFDTNPNAFDGPDPNTLRVGAQIDIPPLTGSLAIARSGIETAGVVVSADRRSKRAAAAKPVVATQERTEPAASVAAGTAAIETRAPQRPSPPPQQVVERDMAVTDRKLEPRNLAMSAGLSSLSTDRLRQRRTGTMAARPGSVVEPATRAGGATQTNLPGQRATAAATDRGQAPVGAPNPATTSTRVITRSRHWLFDWLWLAGGVFFGALLTAFGMRNWLRQQKEAQEEEIARSRRYQEQLDESRQQRTEDTAPAMVVLEELPRMDFTAVGPKADRPAAAPVAEESVGADESGPTEDASSIDESMDELLPDAQDVAPESSRDEPVASPLEEPALQVDELQPKEDDEEEFGSLNESDLELLARDYAQSTGDLGLVEPALDLDLDETAAVLAPEITLGPEEMAASSNGTQIMPGGLDLELPDMLAEEDSSVGEAPAEPAVPEDDDLTRVAIDFDETLLSLAMEEAGNEAATVEEPAAAEDEVAPEMIAAEALSLDAAEDPEDYYHLEDATSPEPGTLTFEEELEQDESKVLSFHKWQDKSSGEATG